MLHQLRPLLTVRLKPELQHVRPQTAGVIIPVGGQGRQPRLLPGGGPIGPVGQQRLGVQGPVLLLCRIAAHRHGGAGGAHVRQEIGALIRQLHHKGEVVRGGHLQKASVLLFPGLTVPRHHIQQRRVRRARGRIRQPLPGVNKVVGGNGLAVGPPGILPQGKGIRLRAVQVILHGIGLGHGGSGLDAAVLPLGELHQILK